MPPWARHPATSYGPATGSPGASLGTNENGAPHFRQNPEVRPGSASRPRPTGSSHRAQNRRLSGTIGFSISASDGSRAGTGAISTSPAPRRRDTPDSARVVLRLIRRTELPEGSGLAARNAPATRNRSDAIHRSI